MLSFGVIACLAALLGGCNWLALVDQSVNGGYSNGNAGWPSLSADGRYVAFHSSASNLVENDTNFHADIFVRDLLKGTTIRASVDSNGNEANRYSELASISGDGRYVAFMSRATNLVPGTTNQFHDIFVHEIATGQTTLVSVDSQGNESNHDSAWPSINHDGRYVAFESKATNLVDEDSNGSSDVFVHDRKTGITIRASVSSTGVQGDRDSRGPKISANGSVVAFESVAGTLDPEKEESADSITRDVFTHVIATGTTAMVSLDNEGKRGGRWGRSSGDATISADGRYVAFRSSSFFDEDPFANPNAIYLRDTVANKTIQLTKSINGEPVRGSSFSRNMSYDGRFVAFESGADNLIENDNNLYTDCFVADAITGSIRMVSAGAQGDPNIGWSDSCAIAGYGRYAAFSARSCFLVSDEACSGLSSVFIRAIPQPTINSIEPDILPIGETTSITISGADFVPGTNIRFETLPLPLLLSDISISNLVRINENTMTIDLFVAPGASPGARSVMAIVPGDGPGPNSGSSDLCEDCITLF